MHNRLGWTSHEGRGVFTEFDGGNVVAQNNMLVGNKIETLLTDHGVK